MEIKYQANAYAHVGGRHLAGHMFCQDRVQAVTPEDGSYGLAVLADGVSTAKVPGRNNKLVTIYPHTDFGANLYVRAVAAEIQLCKKFNFSLGLDEFLPDEFLLSVTGRVENVRKHMISTSAEMNCTLLTAFADSDGGFINVIGDGVTAVKFRDGRILMHKYELEDFVIGPYNIAMQREYIINQYENGLNAEIITCESWLSDPSGFVEQPKQVFTLEQLFNGGITTYFTPEELLEIDSLAVFSDGVTDVEGVNWRNAVYQLLDIGIKRGSFVQRKLSRFVENNNPIDDISCGIVHPALPKESSS